MITPEFEILLHSVRLDDTAAAAERAAEAISRHSIDWVTVYECAAAHCIRPQLEDLLNRIPDPGVPDHIRNDLRSAIRENLLRQLRDLGEFLLVKKVFDESAITAVPFKGLWLAERMYGNIAGREANDLDLFIDINDLERIKAIMNERGFVNTSFINRLRDEYVVRELCEYNLGKYTNDVCIHHFEFHWRSARSVFRMNITLDDLRSQVTTGTIEGNELQVFTPAANLLLVIMHHGGKEQYGLLKQILDIAHIIRRPSEIDWQWLLGQAERLRLSTVLLTGIRMANMVTGVEIPREVANGTGQKRVISLANERLKSLQSPVSSWSTFSYEIRSWRYRIKSREGLLLKVHLLRYFTFKVLMPWLVPQKYHHYFYNRHKRKSNAA